MPLLTSENFLIENESPITFDSSAEKQFPAQNLTVKEINYKIFGCQLEFNRILNELVQLALYKIPLKKVKFYEGSLMIIEFVKTYNDHLRKMIFECQAFHT